MEVFQEPSWEAGLTYKTWARSQAESIACCFIVIRQSTWSRCRFFTGQLDWAFATNTGDSMFHAYKCRKLKADMVKPTFDSSPGLSWSEMRINIDAQCWADDQHARRLHGGIIPTNSKETSNRMLNSHAQVEQSWARLPYKLQSLPNQP